MISCTGILGMYWKDCPVSKIPETGNRSCRIISPCSTETPRPMKGRVYGSVTMKYHASYLGRFESCTTAREWLGGFIDWYNTVHRHSGIGYVTPEQRRNGTSSEFFRRRNETLKKVWERHPERFRKRGPKFWKERRVVYLNPSKETRNFLLKKAS